MSRRTAPAPVPATDPAQQAFQLGYLSAVARMRREVPAAWRESVLGALTRETLERTDREEGQDAGGPRFASHVRGLRLVVMRCEAAALMLSWRKELPERHREQLRAAIAKLESEAVRLGAA